MARPKILLVGHAATDIGLGHLSRLLTLTKKLKESKTVHIELLIFGDPINRKDFKDLETHLLPFSKSFSNSIKYFINKLRPKVIVFDLHPDKLPKNLEALLRWLKKKEVVSIGIDSLLDYCEFLDLLWIPSFYVKKNRKSQYKDKIKYGWDTFLLQKNLDNQEWKDGKNILVLTGGSDSTNLGDTLPLKIDSTIDEGHEVNWVQGPFSKTPILPRKPKSRWFVHKDLEQLDELIIKSNYVLTVFGVSFFEVLQYGIPTVVYSPYGKKDDIELKALKKEEVAVVSQDADKAILDLIELMKDKAKAKRFSKRAVEKLSTNGSIKFAQEINSFIKT